MPTLVVNVQQISSAMMLIVMLRAILCSSSNSVNSRRQLGQCYSHYTEDGCQTCVSRNTSVSCGWCESLSVCAEGTAEGPYSFECPAGDWLFKKNIRCQKTASSCQVSTKDACKAPCAWIKGSCVISSKVKAIEEAKEVQSKKVSQANIVFFGVGIACAIVAIVAIGILVWKSRRPLYKELPLMNSVMKLDALPLPSQVNAQA